MNEEDSKAGPRIVLVGAVQSTELMVRKFAEHEANVVGIFGYEAASTDHVSGYVSLAQTAALEGYAFTPLEK